ncbi:hypothetical protein [Streptosporangium sp. NPDC087985]|uniref:hypothetical protein n=1 Tax=Streptosporangium sp. NPDC087985 TaxID=3366196 RepID=UPI00381FF0F9
MGSKRASLWCESAALEFKVEMHDLHHAHASWLLAGDTALDALTRTRTRTRARSRG